MTATGALGPSVRIDLREGFEDEEVVIRVEGKEVFRKAGVTTLPQIGRADGVDAPVEDGPVTVEVDLPKRGVIGSFSVPAAGMHLGVSLANGALEHEVSPTPFRYA